MYTSLFKVIALCLCCTLFCRCVNDPKVKDNPSSGKQITIEIIDRPDKRKIYQKGKTSGPYSFFEVGLYYYNDNGIRTGYTPQPEIDTLVLTTDRNIFELNINKSLLYDYSYLLEAGENYSLIWDDLNPKLFRNNDEHIDSLLNYQYAVNKDLYKHKTPTHIELLLPFSFLKFNTNVDFDTQIEQYKEEHIPLAKKELLLEQKRIDSLYTIEQYNTVSLNYRQAILNKKVFDVDQSTDNMHRQDSLQVYFQYYNAYLRQKQSQLYKDSVPILKQTNGSFPDDRIYFDLVVNSNHFQSWEKKQLLRNNLENIIRYFSKEDILKYMEKYKQYTRDTLFSNYVVEKHKLDYSSSNQLLLNSLDGTTTDFEKILAQNKGKVIYIDFWASWCAPCRQAMPESKRIEKLFSKDDVVFLYLALNDTVEKWKKAIDLEDLNNVGQHYIIKNSKTSAMIEDLEIHSIPRYVMYDASGKLLYKTAPGPGEELIKAINTALSK